MGRHFEATRFVSYPPRIANEFLGARAFPMLAHYEAGLSAARLQRARMFQQAISAPLAMRSPMPVINKTRRLRCRAAHRQDFQLGFP